MQLQSARLTHPRLMSDNKPKNIGRMMTEMRKPPSVDPCRALLDAHPSSPV